MKGGSISGWRYGPYLSGSNDADGKEALTEILNTIEISEDIDWLMRKKASIEEDKHMAISRGKAALFKKSDAEEFTKEELMEEWRQFVEAKQPEKVKNKIWYKMLGSFTMILRDWTRMRVKVRSVENLIGNKKSSHDISDSDCDGDDTGDKKEAKHN